MPDSYAPLMELFTLHPWVQTTTALLLLLFAALIANWATKYLFLQVLKRILGKKLSAQNQQTLNTPVASRLANIVPAIVIGAGIHTIPHLSETVIKVTQNVSFAFISLTIAIAIGHLLDYINILYVRRPENLNRPIKGYLQLAKLVVYLIASMLVISALIDKSPLLLLSGLGAMAAVLMLIFQDTILSLVASVQISSNGSVRVGDWIEMPQMNADGDVIDIALHTVTVQNFDKTLTVFPTKNLVSQSFKNWRGMFESGGRRIKRSLLIDQNSVRFLNPEETERLRGFTVLDEYLTEKLAEINEWNHGLTQLGKDKINQRRVTNLGTFRAYINHMLRNHARINKEMIAMVRQLQPTPTGLPLELYCFTSTTKWVEYEDIQSDIFDHLLAILPEFGLRLVQQPTGSDLQDLSKALQKATITG